MTVGTLLSSGFRMDMYINCYITACIQAKPQQHFGDHFTWSINMLLVPGCRRSQETILRKLGNLAHTYITLSHTKQCTIMTMTI